MFAGLHPVRPVDGSKVWGRPQPHEGDLVWTGPEREEGQAMAQATVGDVELCGLRSGVR